MNATTRDIIEAADALVANVRDWVRITAGFGISDNTHELSTARVVHDTRDSVVSSLAVLDYLNEADEVLPTPVDDAEVQRWADEVLALREDVQKLQRAKDDRSELADQLGSANEDPDPSLVVLANRIVAAAITWATGEDGPFITRAAREAGLLSAVYDYNKKKGTA